MSHHSDGHHDEHDHEHEGSESMGPLIPPKGHVHEDLIDMTPMVDIVFFLLIFFLTTSMTALQAVMDLPTPQTATDKGAAKSVSDISENKDTLMVIIKEDDTFWIEDEQYFSDNDLRARIRQAREEAGTLSLIVVGNSDASHGAAVRALDAGAGAGVNSLSLLVKDDTDD